jgi:hypothetical protein
MQSLHRNWISVSRLCCPVCWDLFQIIGEHSNLQDPESDNPHPFVVRGRHSNVYDVELPYLLPQDILEKMIDRFQSYVYMELEQLP